MRLDKYVAGAAQQSRSDVRRAIQKGLVCVNGAVCRSADAQVPAGAAVTLNGQPLVLQQYVYIMLDKPKGVVSAAADKKRRDCWWTLWAGPTPPQPVSRRAAGQDQHGLCAGDG